MKNQLIKAIEEPQLKERITVRTGDSVEAKLLIKEGDKQKIKSFKGIVISQKRGGLGANITLRKISHGIGVEQVIQLHSPMLMDLKLIKPGKVRQSRIYYIRKLKGRAMRIAERLKKATKVVSA